MGNFIFTEVLVQYLFRTVLRTFVKTKMDIKIRTLSSNTASAEQLLIIIEKKFDFIKQSLSSCYFTIRRDIKLYFCLL